MTTVIDSLNRRLDEILQHLYGFMGCLGDEHVPGHGNPLAEWVVEEIHAARWAEPDDYGLDFKRTAIRAFEETRYYQTFVRAA